MALAQANAPAIFDLKSASLSVVALLLQTHHLDDLARELARRFDAYSGFFNHDPVVVDLAAVANTPASIDFKALIELLRHYKMQLVGARAGNTLQMQAARSAGLFDMPADLARHTDSPATPAPVGPSTASPTKVLHRPLRSGQQIYARGGDLVILAAVNFGAEVIADGHIHVYAPLRGKAIAGAKGNTEARIFSTCMEPELVAIAGTYRTTETPLHPEIVGKPAQIRLQGERLVFEALI